MGMILLIFLPLLLLATVSSVTRETPPGFKNWKCKLDRNHLGGDEHLYASLLKSTCADLKDSLNQCCVKFNDCNSRNDFNCVETHEECNAKVISGRENECSAISDHFLRQDLRRLPDKDWKCHASPMPGAWAHNYLALITGTCGTFKDKLNECCVNFNDCDSKNGFNCVDLHEECNAKVIAGRENDCSAIANRFIEQYKRRLPDNSWKCQPPKDRIGGWDQDYRTLIQNQFCAGFKDRINQCCVNFNDCDKSHKYNCVEEHEKCNAEVISGQEGQCSAIVDRFIRKDRRVLPDKDWKCHASPLLGALDQSYRVLITSRYCSDLKDGLNQCCISFNDCDSKNGFNCVEKHEECNAQVISGREEDCSAIANRFIEKNKRRLPDKDWKCHASPKLGAFDQNYRVLVSSPFCSDLKDRLNDCCISFNDCDSKHSFNCVEKHEECNAKVISGREKDCSAIAENFIEKYKRRLPDKDWKCQPPKGRLGGFGQDYRTLIQSHDCADFKDGLNQCCVNFNSCSGNKRTGCVDQHKDCNSRVISGREKECSAIANKFIQDDESDETSYRVVIYFKRVILYTKEQFNQRPFQSSIILTLLIFVSFGFVCGICCICCLVLSKSNNRKERGDHHHSSSRASSVRSSSVKN